MRMIVPFLLVIPAICPAQTPAPVIHFEKTHHDFGKIDTERKATYRFKVSNTGQAPLKISRVNTTCGCTSTVLGKWVLAPGEVTEIETSFDPRGYRGLVRKAIQVLSDDPAQPSVTLSFQAEVVQDIMPSTTAVFFYDVQRDAREKKTIRLVSGNGQPVQVKALKSPGAPYLSTISRLEGNDAVLEVTLDGQKIAPGRMRGVDQVTAITGSARMPVISLRVQWEMRASVVATPERISWLGQAGKALQSPVQLKQAQGKAFRILEFRSTHPAVTVKGIGKEPATQYDFQIVLSGSVKPGTYNESVVFSLDDPDQKELTLRVSAVLQ